MKNFQTIIHKIGKTLLILLGFTCFCVGIYSALYDKTSSAALCLPLSLLFILCASPESFESLKGPGGFEAKMRDLTNKIDEAERILEKIRKSAELSGKFLISIASKTGRFGGAPTITESHLLAESIKTQLKDLGSSEKIISDTLFPWIDIVSWDLIATFIRRLESIFHNIAHDDVRKNLRISPLENDELADHSKIQAIIDDEYSKLRKIYKIKLETRFEHLLQFLNETPILNEVEKTEFIEEVKAWHPEFLHLARHSEFLNPDAWYKALDRKD